ARSVGEDEGALILRGGVEPQLLIADPGGGVVERVFARAHAALEWRDHTALRARLRQDLAYGSIDLSPLSGPTPAPGGPSPSRVPPPPATPIVLLEESTTSAALEIALSTRARLQTDAVWQVSGGADETSRNSVPLARGPRLRSQFGYLLTHLDRLDAELGGFDTRYSNGR